MQRPANGTSPANWIGVVTDSLQLPLIYIDRLSAITRVSDRPRLVTLTADPLRHVWTRHDRDVLLVSSSGTRYERLKVEVTEAAANDGYRQLDTVISRW